MRQASIRSSPVVEPLMPILGSIRPIENPGSVASTMNAVIPASARANTTYVCATPAFVMNRFVPSSTQSSPSRRARVPRAWASEPAAGSVRAYAAIHSPLAQRGT